MGDRGEGAEVALDIIRLKYCLVVLKPTTIDRRACGKYSTKSRAKINPAS